MKVVTVNVDESPGTPARFGVRAIPNLVVLRAGRVAEQIVGAVAKSRLVQAIEAAIA